MQVKIVETGAIEELCAIDGATGCEWTADLIGNNDAFNASQFYREQDEDGEDVLEYWAASQAEYNWWAAVVADLNKADALRPKPRPPASGRKRLKGITWTSRATISTLTLPHASSSLKTLSGSSPNRCSTLAA